MSTDLTKNAGANAPALAQAPATVEPAPVVQPVGSWQGPREIISAILSLAIVVVALAMLGDTYLTGRANMGTGTAAQAPLDAYNRQRDVLLVALGLLGTVTGYYLGRTPAELRATTAQQAATTATQNADTANQVAQAATKTTDTVKQGADAMLAQVSDRLSRAQVPRRATLGAPPEPAETQDATALEDIRRDIEQFRKQLRS